MRYPTVHLNGTSGDELVRQLQEAWVAVKHAMDALTLTMPNGRDYYVQEADSMSNAMAEYRKRYALLETVQDELTEIWEAVQDQIDKRKPLRQVQ